jgi:branched-chain amino acid transport system permease protein
LNFYGLLEAIALGILAGAVYGLASVGLSLVFGVMRLVNFAHGDFIMIGMYVAYWFTSATGWSVYASIPVVVLFLAVMSYVVFYVLFRKSALTGRHTDQLVISLGLAILLEAAAQQIFGSNSLSVPAPTGGITIGAIVLPTTQLVAFGVGIAAVVALEIVLNHTVVGRGLRAVVSDREMASILGIPVGTLYVAAFVVSGVLAGLAGVVLVAYYPVSPTVGLNFILICFVCVLMGGAGDIIGTFVAGIIVGIIESVTATFWHPAYQDVVVYGVFIVVALVRPQGVLGRSRA